MPEIQQVLGFDFGIKRIGVASGQTITCSATPLVTLPSVNNKADWSGIEKLIQQYKPHALIVGLPYYLDGSKSEMTERAEKFSRQLEGRFHLPVYTHNEALSSFEAEQFLQAKKKQHNKQDIDKIAAAIIVQSWLEQNT
ncbi:Putative pre-16S rRNA nuclease Yqg [hydrothermal vent metagenome]|uniref:Pre-16S rRNA nuclease Yqg n=1 Tax=hydrothermal vent metagenome TaxID=652676 RepID=A0A3B0XR29_9ZZZZ